MKIIEKENFTFLKGIAIIFMVVHHTFGFPEWYVDTVNYPNLMPFVNWIRDSMKICVPIFVFLTGGGYFLRQRKDFKYSIKKIVSFYLNYWVVFFVLLLVAVFCGNYYSIGTVILEALGIKTKLMYFCWYVLFYVVIMAILPIYVRLLKGKFYVDIFKTFVFYCCIRFIESVMRFFEINSKLLNDLSIYFPVLVTGYLLIKYDMLDRIRNKIRNMFLSRQVQILVGMVLICISLLIHARIPYLYGVSMGFVLVPVLILGLSLVFVEKNYIQKAIQFLGKNSMNIWFLHCAFFSPYTKGCLQPIAYFPRIPLLVVIWVLFLCLLVSLLINKVQKKIQKIMSQFK